MADLSVRQVQGAGALSAEDYQTFEMAKANDTILGGDDIAQIRSYAAFARAQAQAIHKSIATMGELDDVAQAKAEMTETSQTFAKVSVYADVRIGELLKELPTRQGKRTDLTSIDTPIEVTKSQARHDAGISQPTASDLEKMAANPEVVEAVIAKATEEGKVVSRSQVLKAIKEREEAEKERDAARHAEHMMHREVESMRQALAERPEPEVIEREVFRDVVPDDYEPMKRELRDSRRQRELYTETNRNLRKKIDDMEEELAKAREAAGTSENMHAVRRDVQYLISATNSYIRQYGGLTWTVQQLEQVDDVTLGQLKAAIANLATFSGALVSSINNLGNM